MNIISLQVENIKKIKAIEIKPEGNTVMITGKNGNGKSSTIDSIAFALGGKKLIPDKPVRDGETKAKIQVDLGEYLVTRHWTNPDTSYLKLETKDGHEVKKAQNILDQLVGNLSFDPIEFTLLEPKKRLEILKGITGLDFSALDAEYKQKYHDRTLTNREIEQKKQFIAGFELSEMPDVEPDKVKAEADKEAAVKHNKDIEDAHSQIKTIADSIETSEGRIKQYEAAIEAQKKAIETYKAKQLELAELTNQGLLDVSQYDAIILEWHKYSAVKDQIERKAKLESELKYSIDVSEIITKRLAAIDKEKEDLLKQTDMPIDGLSFGDGEVYYNDIPFGQLSSSEQIKVSMAMAIAQNPKVKIIIIKNGSLLDADSLNTVKTIAAEKDFQLWIEQVADSANGNSIYIEDGNISN